MANHFIFDARLKTNGGPGPAPSELPDRTKEIKKLLGTDAVKAFRLSNGLTLYGIPETGSKAKRKLMSAGFVFWEGPLPTEIAFGLFKDSLWDLRWDFVKFLIFAMTLILIGYALGVFNG